LSQNHADQKRLKEEPIQEAIREGDWYHALAYEASYDRFSRLLSIWFDVPPDQRRSLLEDWWDMCDGNLWHYRRNVVAMFKDVGYCGDALGPDKPTTLYRGTTHSRWRRGVSWTGDIKVARFFADGGRFGPMGGVVCAVVAPPEAVLARFNRRQEDEYVLDIDLLPRVRRLEVVQKGEGRRNWAEMFGETPKETLH
jgi:hypothetical protein